MQGEHRFDPWSGKIPHASEQLSLPITTTEPARPKACGAQEKTLQRGRISRGTTQRSHCLPQLGKAHTQQPRPSTAKNKIFSTLKKCTSRKAVDLTGPIGPWSGPCGGRGWSTQGCQSERLFGENRFQELQEDEGQGDLGATGPVGSQGTGLTASRPRLLQTQPCTQRHPKAHPHLPSTLTAAATLRGCAVPTT